MVNLKEELQKFRAINLKSLEESISDLSDDMRNSIILYNKAIESLAKGSEDIAIIELKKAVSINPGFHEAMNLLGLCYAFTGEKEKAADIFERVIESERNGIQALGYRKSVGGGSIPVELQTPASGQDKAEKKAGKVSERKKSIKKTRNERNLKSSTVRFTAGFAAGVLLMFAVAYPYVFGKKEKSPPQTDVTALNQLKDDKENLQKELNDITVKYNEMEDKYSGLTDELETANEKIEYLTIVRQLFEVGFLRENGSYQEAAELIINIEDEKLESRERQWLDAIKVKILPEAALMAYEEGKDLCHNQKEYEKGLEELKKVKLYKSDFEQEEGLLYYMGKCYQGLGQYDEAMECYNSIMEKYPNGYYVQFIGYRMSEIRQATGDE